MNFNPTILSMEFVLYKWSVPIHDLKLLCLKIKTYIDI